MAPTCTKLSSTLEELKTSFEPHFSLEELFGKNGMTLAWSALNGNLKKIAPALNSGCKQELQYSIPGLYTGRPLDQVIVMLAGSTGSGKSSTINTLFEDDTLCKVSNKTSSTSNVYEVKKKLTITDEEPPIEADLVFVDVPGSLDTNRANEAENYQKILSYREKHKALCDRDVSMKMNLIGIRRKVFPNLVLFVIRATDNRTEGPDSNFTLSLKTLKNQKLVDCSKPNLIVVITHGHYFGNKPEKYKKKSGDFKRVVRKAVKEILTIVNVPISIVENEGEDYLEKAEKSDFYALPDGEFSHANLIKEMYGLFEKNEDKLGFLLTSWYFKSDCPEKKKKATTSIADYSSQVPNVESRQVQQMLQDLNIIGEVTPIYKFQSLGYAFCPITESMKCHYLFNSSLDSKQQPLKIKKASFLIPKHVKYYQDNLCQYKSLTCNTKEDYESKKSNQYGFEADVKLVVKVSSSGKWSSNVNVTNTEKIVSTLFEKSVCSLQIDSPERYITDEFAAELTKLPSKYDKETANDFTQFFSKYGTHLVAKQKLGGWIRFDCHIAETICSKENTTNIQTKAEGLLKSLIGGGSYNYETAYKELQAIGVLDETITIGGGVPPLVSSLRAITNEELNQWLESVEVQPSEMEHSRSLYPFYCLSQCKNVHALKEATLEYLKDTLQQKMLTRRNEIAEEGLNAAQAPSSSSCFPGSTLITTKNGKKRMDELERLEEIQTMNGCKAAKWTTFYGFVHREPETKAGFMQFKLSNDKELIVTGEHLIFEAVEENGILSRKSTLACKINKGDKLFYTSEEGINCNVTVIQKTAIVCTGIFAPLTMSGDFNANGFLVSCYAEIENFSFAHAVFKPMRLWAQIRPNLLKNDNQEQLDGIHPYALTLMKLRKIVSFPLQF